MGVDVMGYEGGDGGNDEKQAATWDPKQKSKEEIEKRKEREGRKHRYKILL